MDSPAGNCSCLANSKRWLRFTGREQCCYRTVDVINKVMALFLEVWMPKIVWLATPASNEFEAQYCILPVPKSASEEYAVSTSTAFINALRLFVMRRHNLVDHRQVGTGVGRL